MSHTVVGLFNNKNEALAAKQQLFQKGFMEGNVDVSHRSAATTDAVKTTAQIEVTDSVGNFFNSLFGGDETTARNYSNAAGDADAILTVHTDSVEKARQAAEILDHNGAIDIDAASSRQSQQNTTEATQTTTRNTAHTAETTERNVADTKVANTQSEKTIPIIEEQMHDTTARRADNKS